MHQNMNSDNQTSENERIARATLLRMGFSKWLCVHLADAFFGFLVKHSRKSRPSAAGAHTQVKILVIEYWQLGDLAILVPFLRRLRHVFSNAHISLVVNITLQEFLQGQGLVDEFIPVRVPWTQHFSRWKKYNPFSSLWIPFFRTILELRTREFSFGFSGRMDFRDNLLLWMSGATRRIGYGFAGGSSFLTDSVPPDISQPHRADLWLNLLAPFASEPLYDPEEFLVEQKMRQAAADFLQSLNIDQSTFLIGIHPGARSAVRRWGDDKFADVANSLLRETDATVLWFSEPRLERLRPLIADVIQSLSGLRSFSQS